MCLADVQHFSSVPESAVKITEDVASVYESEIITCSSFYCFAVDELKIMSQPPVGSFAVAVGLNGRGNRSVRTLHVVRFAVFTAAILRIVLLWAMTTCSLVGGYRHFGGACCFHLQGEMCMLKNWLW